MLVSTKSTI